jgi:hypothetical protein
MKTITVLIVLAICSNAFAQPRKQNPPPFDKTLSTYTQSHIQDSLFNKHPLAIKNGGFGDSTVARARVILLPDTTGQTGKKLTVKAGGGFDWE